MAKMNTRSMAWIALLSPPVIYGALNAALWLDVSNVDPISSASNSDGPFSLLVRLLAGSHASALPVSQDIQLNVPDVQPVAIETAIEPIGGVFFLFAFSAATGYLALWPLLILSFRLVGPGRSVLAMVFAITSVVFAYARIYQLGGIQVDNHPVAEPQFAETLYLSMTMMSSLGFGDIIGDQAVRMYVATQSIFGFFMMGSALGITVAILAEETWQRRR